MYVLLSYIENTHDFVNKLEGMVQTDDVWQVRHIMKWPVMFLKNVYDMGCAESSQQGIQLQEVSKSCWITWEIFKSKLK